MPTIFGSLLYIKQTKRKDLIMKIRDISLVAAGTIISVVLIVLVFTFTTPPKAQAQAAAAGGGTTVMTVTNGPQNNIGTGGNAGIITINDSSLKRVTVVSYAWSTSPSTTVHLSPPASFSY
jgi:hypothetical protein